MLEIIEKIQSIHEKLCLDVEKTLNYITDFRYVCLWFYYSYLSFNLYFYFLCKM